MASPFSVFRRNQKVMLAFVAIAAIGAFVFLQPLMQYIGGSSRSANPVVVETKYGDLTASQLQALLAQRNVVDRFLRAAAARTVAAQMNQPNVDPRWLDNFAQQRYLALRQNLLGRSQEDPQAAAVETMVLSKRAENMGVVVTDQAVNNLIRQITGNVLSRDEIMGLLASMRPAVSLRTLFNALRTEMLAMTSTRLFVQSVQDVPPAQRFEYYTRLNRRAKAEVMGLAVADFLGQVTAPQEAELKAYYEKYKDDYPDPTTPEPGFKEPVRATFQYFTANLDRTAKKLESEVTDEEIEKYYEENKSRFLAFDSQEADMPAEKKPEESEEAASPDEKPEEAGSESKGDAPQEEKPDKPAAEDKPATGEEAPPMPESEGPGDAPAEAQEKASTDESPAEEASEASKDDAETPPADEPADDDAADAKEPQARATRPPAEFRLVAFAQDEQSDASEDAQPDPPADETPEDAPSATETKDATTDEEPKPASEPPAEDAPADEKPAEPKKPADDAEPDAKPAEDPAPSEPAQPDPAAEQKDSELKFEPLEKVKDTIRADIAQEKARELVTTQLEELSSKMRAFTDEWDLYIAEKGTNENAQAPTPLDFSKLAEGTELEAHELTSISPYEAAKEGIGKAARFVVNPNSGGQFTMPFVQFAFSEQLPLYKPETVMDNDNNTYLFWKTAEEPAYVPPFDQVRTEVERAWKMVRARDLARKRAEEYAKQVRSLKKPMSELFGGQANVKITEAGPFSWLTLGNVPSGPDAQPHLSDIEGVDQAGPDFMRTVFQLEPSGVGVAMNVPKDMVYVVRAIDFEPPLDQLRESFASAPPNRYMSAALEDQREVFRAWLDEVNRDADVKWVQQEDDFARRDEAGL
ncbi:MAG: hypothetical protein DWQ37_16945 [Planctomycetota bacterium]|nr:MAG: hypothetical protein DWQ37_16945 [Planctomycetota bacterium]